MMLIKKFGIAFGLLLIVGLFTGCMGAGEEDTVFSDATVSITNGGIEISSKATLESGHYDAISAFDDLGEEVMSYPSLDEQGSDFESKWAAAALCCASCSCSNGTCVCTGCRPCQSPN